jgi:twinkle protein
MDNDGPRREGAETFAKKLGMERCLVIRPSGKRGWRGGKARKGANNGDCSKKDDGIGSSESTPPPPPKDANEALLTGWDIGELLEEAAELPHERILKFSDLRDQVIHEIINPEKYRGAPIPSLPGFTHLIKDSAEAKWLSSLVPLGLAKRRSWARSAWTLRSKA